MQLGKPHGEFLHITFTIENLTHHMQKWLETYMAFHSTLLSPNILPALQQTQLLEDPVMNI